MRVLAVIALATAACGFRGLGGRLGGASAA